jgi:phosphatidylserine decarboxylase
MRIHKEGRITLLIIAVFILAINFIVIKGLKNEYLIYPVAAASLSLYVFNLYFFRVPKRNAINDSNAIMSPCDGKVVVIEEAFEEEFLQCKTLKVSIFMSPLDVHMNWYPVNGKILYKKMHKGTHLVAWAPKSSSDNERSTVAIETPQNQKIVVRQIAGAVARRVVCYAQKDNCIDQNGQLGFIKFGSRVDLFLPLNTDIKVKLNQTVIGTQTVIARFKNDK